ncbi:MAG TPA: RluA family pseudouridine synthase [Acidimicrobiales bacterium]|nr:RluA family pseudouridine synthase [Acidimicrobiales bacterium]
MTGETRLSEVVPAALAGERLDRVTAMATGLPRSEVVRLLTAGAVTVDGEVVTARARRLVEGETIDIRLPAPADHSPAPDPSVPVDVVLEDRWLLVVDKRAGQVVHPGAGNPGGTLVNGLLARYPAMRAAGDPDRPGIVHRLDKGTSGLMIVALSAESHEALTTLMAARAVDRRYLALVAGRVEAGGGVVDAPLGRSSRQPTRMAVSVAGREARTRYEVLERLAGVSLLECKLETGRTHQIRVHLAAIGHPVVGDQRYGARTGRGAGRPFLHAHRIGFDHPFTGERIELSSPLPEDLAAHLDRLRRG